LEVILDVGRGAAKWFVRLASVRQPLVQIYEAHGDEEILRDESVEVLVYKENK
jgi:hypothetical protein